MAVIGNSATQQAFTPAVDYFSGNASTTAFTLSRPVASVAQVEAVVNNVVQNPSSAYTVSGNTITFTSAPSSGTNNIYVRYTSPITQVIAPGQGTVTTTSLDANLLVPLANGGTAATTASGARTSLGLVIGTDVLAPTGSGASLTALNASNISSGTVPTARLGSGTASSSTYLRGDNTWATVSGGVTSVATGNGLSGGTITSTGTLTLAAPSGLSIGSHLYGSIANNLGTISVGGTLAGSNINYANCGNWNSNGMQTTGSFNPSGTWQYMGGSGYSFLFVRVS